METDSTAPTSFQNDRRRDPRYRCQGSAEILVEGSETARKWGTVTDLSRSGCYIEMPAPLSQGQKLSAKLTVLDESFFVQATVAVVHPMFGMGLMFTSVMPEGLPTFEKVLQQLSGPTEPAAEWPVEPGLEEFLQPAAPLSEISGESAMAILAEIADHLSQRGTLTQAEFLGLLEKTKSR